MEMTAFDWGAATQGLETFGGRDKTIRVPKTGLPFFDVLRLYGAIEMYLGLSGEVTITDAGSEWEINGSYREGRLVNKQHVAELIGDGKTKQYPNLIRALDGSVESGVWPEAPLFKRKSPVNTPDASLQSGQRNQNAISYDGLVSDSSYAPGQYQMLWADKALCLTAQLRIQVCGDIVYLPIFEGKVDFTRVISPVGNQYGIPNVLCSQVLALLKLKTTLLEEGYAQQLSGIVFNRRRNKASDNFSGLVAIDSTAIGRKRERELPPAFYGHCYRVFRSLIGRAWKNGKSTGETDDAFAHAYWFMQPERSQHLGSLLAAIERQARDRRGHLLLEWKNKSEIQSYAKEIFMMTYNTWNGNHNAVRKLARAVASSIWLTRQKKEKTRAEQGKAWYDEAVMLRSAPTAKAFFERALILIEQGKREDAFIGSVSREQDFDVVALRESIGTNRRDFETFRDLFRMYLIQESTPHLGTSSATTDESANAETEVPSEQGEED